jgi:hypothetical protein
LAKLVDLVIIAESSLTHSGRHKSLHFSRWLESKPEFKNRVKVLEVSLSSESTHMEREIATRETLISYVAHEFPEARFILSDLDEIPSHKQIESFLKLQGNFHFITSLTYRYANWHLTDEQSSWKKGVMGNAELASLPNGGRMEKLPILIAPDKGLHLSYLHHDPAKLEEKLISFVHQELNFPEMYSPATLKFADYHRIDHLGRFGKRGRGLLNQKVLSELSDLQLHALNFQPSWFNFDSRQPRQSRRKFASLVITTLSKEKNDKSLIYRKFILHNKTNCLDSIRAYLALLNTCISSYLTLFKHNLKIFYLKRF